MSQNIMLILLKMTCKKKKRFLVDGMIRARLITSNGIGCVERMSRRRKRSFLLDGIIRRTPVTPNMILGQFKVSWRGQR